MMTSAERLIAAPESRRGWSLRIVVLEGTRGTLGKGTVQKTGVRFVSLCFKPRCFRPFAKRPFAKRPFAKRPFGPLRLLCPVDRFSFRISPFYPFTVLALCLLYYISGSPVRRFSLNPASKTRFSVSGTALRFAVLPFAGRPTVPRFVFYHFGKSVSRFGSRLIRLELFIVLTVLTVLTVLKDSVNERVTVPANALFSTRLVSE